MTPNDSSRPQPARYLYVYVMAVTCRHRPTARTCVSCRSRTSVRPSVIDNDDDDDWATDISVRLVLNISSPMSKRRFLILQLVVRGLSSSVSMMISHEASAVASDCTNSRRQRHKVCKVRRPRLDEGKNCAYSTDGQLAGRFRQYPSAAARQRWYLTWRRRRPLYWR